jgi:hypothetical protein
MLLLFAIYIFPYTHMKNYFSWNCSEKRLLQFGIRAIESRSSSDNQNEGDIEKKTVDNPQQAKKNRQEIVQRKQQREKAETQDKKEDTQKLKALEGKIGAGEKKESPSEARKQWLLGIETTLKLEKGSLSLGEADVRVRAPVEQHGIYLKGKIIGNIAAGYDPKTGKVDRNEMKYDFTSKPPEVSFRKAGFEEQVQDVVENNQ